MAVEIATRQTRIARPDALRLRDRPARDRIERNRTEPGTGTINEPRPTSLF